MLLAVISDTHMPSRAADLPAPVWEAIRQADVTIHAGDVTEPAVLERISSVRPVIAVRGNNDFRLDDLPERLETVLGGVPVAVVHDAGAAAGRRERLRRMFPDARVVVFGHSHVPFLEDDGTLLLLNPGSPTDRRRMPTFTMATLSLRDGLVEDARIIDLGGRRRDVVGDN